MKLKYIGKTEVEGLDGKFTPDGIYEFDEIKGLNLLSRPERFVKIEDKQEKKEGEK